MLWVMSYTTIRRRREGPPEVHACHRVTDRHPLVVIGGWNSAAEAEEDRRPGVHQRRAVLTWYAPLSAAEGAELTAAGIDPSAIDVELAANE